MTAAASAAVKAMPKDFRVSITNAPGKGVYPISSFTWILLYENPKDKGQTKVMVDFMKWALTDGQKFAGDSGTHRFRRKSSSSKWRRSRRSKSPDAPGSSPDATRASG